MVRHIQPQHTVCSIAKQNGYHLWDARATTLGLLLNGYPYPRLAFPQDRIVRITLITNPVASSVTRRATIVIQKALAADHELDVHETSRSGQGIRLAHGAARGGADVIIALGGDGTINEVVNGAMGEATAVVPLPGGSTNVFARSLGYPNNAIEATSVLIDALAARNIRPASVGVANGRAFLFHVGAGFDAAVVERVERRGQLKRWLGHAYFTFASLRTLFSRPDRQNLSLSASTDTGESISSAKQITVFNTSPYSYFGHFPLRIAPEASIDTPLSAVALANLSPMVLARIIQALRHGQGLPDSPRTRHWSDIRQISIRSDREFLYQLDGEVLDPVTELDVTHHPDAVNVVMPLPQR